jgi:hypothetical protein
MRRTVFAIAVAGLIFAAVSGTAQAAPGTPLPSGVTAELNFDGCVVASLLARPLGALALPPLLA